jgi:hypothetical protein
MAMSAKYNPITRAEFGFVQVKDGVLCYEGTQCQRFTYQDGLPYPYVDAVQVDRAGHIWFATWGAGWVVTIHSV